MDKKRVAYIATTSLFCLGILPGAAMDIVQPDMIVEIVEGLGLPLPMLTLIGVWKLLGVVGLAQSRLPTAKEWAYAGFFFDLTGAAYLHATAGDVPGVFPPLVLLAVLGASYALRPDRPGAPSAPARS